jgi:hypothetical protein
VCLFACSFFVLYLFLRAYENKYPTHLKMAM